MFTSSPINVLQLIDSLDAGGGERMSVHLANTLSDKVEFSSLVASRRSGVLEYDILPEVEFCCLNKTSTLDFNALFKLRRFVKKHHINIIHAHSTSFFLATQLKIVYPKIKIIWHDHYGFRHRTSIKQNIPLFFCSHLFSQIIAVNEKLKKWAKTNLKCKNVEYIQNFSLKNHNLYQTEKIQLKGDSKAFKVIHVANLRPQKDHLTALKAIRHLVNEGINVSYHLIGNYDSESIYYRNIIDFINNSNLSKHVFIYGSQNNIPALLEQSNLGILSSISEGLPVSLIEYIQAKIPIVVTDVGQCKEVVGDFALVVKSQDSEALAQAIKYNLNQPNEAHKNAQQLCNKITEEFNPKKIIQKFIKIYTNVINN